MKRFAQVLFLLFALTTSLFAQDDEYGIGSYYSDLFHGKPTASGELYNKNEFTAAHKTLPFGTLVKVTRLDNNKSVQVRINDRGPFISGRVVEMSRAAADRLDLPKDGSTRVKLEVVNEKTTAEPSLAVKETAPKSYETETPAIKTETPKTEVTPKGGAPSSQESKKTEVEKPKAEMTAKAAETKPSTGNAVLVKGKDYQPFDLYQVELKRPDKKGYGVQIAALSSQEALFRKIADLQGDWFDSILVSVEKAASNDVMYKVILGNFLDENSAQAYKASLKKNKNIDGFVVDLATLAPQK